MVVLLRSRTLGKLGSGERGEMVEKIEVGEGLVFACDHGRACHSPRSMVVKPKRFSAVRAQSEAFRATSDHDSLIFIRII
jgi:hypothetical protein